VSNPKLKHEIRLAAEKEEREFYSRRANPVWIADLAPLGTDEHKEFLDVAPWLIVVFKQMKDERGLGHWASGTGEKYEDSNRQRVGTASASEHQGPRPSAQGPISDQVYYVNESVGIAVGMLLAAIHMAGLVALTHTPSPMKFLSEVLHPPRHERPFLLIPVGYAADDCSVPDVQRKPLNEIMVVEA
jgi:hypothetical protein